MPRKDPFKKSLKSIDQSLHLVLVNRYGLSRGEASTVKTLYLRGLKTQDWKTPLGFDKQGKPITVRRVRASFVNRFKAKDFGAKGNRQRAERLYNSWENQKLQKVKVPKHLRHKVKLTAAERWRLHGLDIQKVIAKIMKDKHLSESAKLSLKQRLERLTRPSKKNKEIIKFFSRMYTKGAKMGKDPKTKKLIEKIRKGSFDSKDGSKDVKQMKKDNKEEDKKEPEEPDESEEWDKYEDVQDQLAEFLKLGSKEEKADKAEELKKSREKEPKDLKERKEKEERKIKEAKKRRESKESDLTPEQRRLRDEYKRLYGIDLDKPKGKARRGSGEAPDIPRKRKKFNEEPPPTPKSKKRKPKARKKKKKTSLSE